MSTFPVTLSGQPNTKMWAEEHLIEPQALEQIRHVANLPLVHSVRVMPDVHLGAGATIGSVIAMKNALSPSAVGVDIGCGVAAVKTNLTWNDLPDDLLSLRLGVESAIPVGFNSHDQAVKVNRLGLPTAQFDALFNSFKDLHPAVQNRADRAAVQMGTLGGGNHFLEVCVDENESIWLTLHSGSRNIGKELAEVHIAIAKTLPQNADLPARDLSFFIGGTPEMDAYRRDLTWAQDYARLSRLTMLALFEGVMKEHFPTVQFGERISCHHNYVGTETVDGEELIVTRKGAIRAGEGDLGIIPGSMGTGSFIVRGLGNVDSLYSASHGAGRKMSRSKAKKTFTVDDLAAQTAGIECRKDQGVVDEIPGAYKDIESVMKSQDNLVEPVARLQTLLCVKG